MRYEERPPSVAFAPVIEAFWTFETIEITEPRPHVVVPDGTVSLSLRDQGGAQYMMIVGPQTRARRVEVHPGAVYRGVRFRAGAVKAALGVTPEPWLDTVVPLGQVRPDLASGLAAGYRREAGLAGFAAQVEAALTLDVRVLDREVATLVKAIAAAEGEAPLGGLMAAASLGPRQLRRRFIAATGLSPKTYVRLRRVRRACIGLASLPPGELAALSVEAGYADQPHFSRDMREVFGMSPQMLHAYLRQIAHHNVADRPPA